MFRLLTVFLFSLADFLSYVINTSGEFTSARSRSLGLHAASRKTAHQNERRE